MTQTVDRYRTPAALVNHSEIMFLSPSMVLSYVVLDIVSTSNHLECESTTTRNIHGPAKSTCMSCHGAVGQVHGCVGACGGLACTD